MSGPTLAEIEQAFPFTMRRGLLTTWFMLRSGVEDSDRETDYLAVYVIKSALDDILVFLSYTTVISRTWTKIGFMTWLAKHNAIFGT